MPTRDLVSMARRGLRLELRAALRKALATGQVVGRTRIDMDVDGGSHPIALTIEPLQARDGVRLFMVVFSEAGGVQPLEPEEAAARTAQGSNTEQLERELNDTREQLQSTAEEYETALEELKSANEELQSSNDELETSREEIRPSMRSCRPATRSSPPRSTSWIVPTAICATCSRARRWRPSSSTGS